MARTKADARSLFLRLLDEATKKGVDLPIIKNADYRDKFDYFLDSAQKYIAGIIKIPSVFQVTQNPIPNLLGLMQGFDMVQVLPGTDKVFNLVGCKSCYFEMDNVGVATIKVNGVLVQTITNTVKRTYTSYKALISASATDNVEIRFTATYPFNIRNTGFYGYTFPLAEDVPEYTPYTEYDMPSDFMSFDIPIIKSDPRVYESYTAYKWENNKKIIFEYYKTGSFDIHYFKYPSDILHDAIDSTPLEIEEKAFELVVLDSAIKSTAADNTALSSWLRSIFVEKMQNITNIQMPSDSAIQTIYSI